MYRVEIIANQSVQDDIIETLEENIPGFLYTLSPLVHGRGKAGYKLGTSSWPEVNFALFAYIEKKDAGKVKAIIKAVKKQFPDE
ncbi:MAG: hypothetical protein IJR40_02560, partial [Treponema sp.]|nr:hypothetical protein [Treponema sp.]